MTNRLKGKNKVKKWLGYGKKNYHATLDFKESCYDLKFTFEIKIWFKVTAHLLSTSTVHVKYKLDTAIERYNMVETRILLV